MKKIISLFVLAIGFLAIFEQTSNAQEARRDNFEKMTFEVELNKTNYVLLEPMNVNFRFANRTLSALKVDAPYFLNESKLLVTANGKTSVFENLSSANKVPSVRFPATYKPGTFAIGEEIFSPAFTGAFFPEPGTYRLQFVLRSSDAAKTISSNVVEITVAEPQGMDKSALEFMKSNKEFFGLSSWTGDEAETLLESFVKDYGRSVYGDLAINGLAHIYLGKGKLEKAAAEFEKLRESRSPAIKKDAADSLVNIEKKVRTQRIQNNDKP